MILEGRWIAVEAELGGNKMSSSLLSSILLTIKNNAYTARVADVTDKGTLSLNTDLVPHTMDIVGTDGPNKGKTIKVIHKVAANELVVCYNLSGDEYPEEFVSRLNSQLFLVKYKRRRES